MASTYMTSPSRRNLLLNPGYISTSQPVGTCCSLAKFQASKFRYPRLMTWCASPACTSPNTAHTVDDTASKPLNLYDMPFGLGAGHGYSNTRPVARFQDTDPMPMPRIYSQICSDIRRHGSSWQRTTEATERISDENTSRTSSSATPL